MPTSDTRGHGIPTVAPEDVKRILGDLDEARLLALLALEPTIGDVEDASMWLSGDRDVFGPGEPLAGIAGEIVAIVTADEDEEPPGRT